MCDAKPGLRCATDTRDAHLSSGSIYRDRFADAAPVDPLTSAAASFPSPTVQVLDRRGDPVTLTPGVLDDAAQYAYMNGQCLAFAAALAERGCPVEVCLAGNGLAWESETTEFHAWDTHLFVHAVGADGDQLLDIQGEHERDGFLEAMRDAHGSAVLVPVSADQLRTLMAHPSVVDQDVTTARTMVEAMWFTDDQRSDPVPMTDRAQFEPAEPCPPGYVDLYHRTTAQSADEIAAGGRMRSAENTDESYFSTRVDGQTDGYGDTVVWVRLPLDDAELDDEFPDGEQHYRVPNRLIGQRLMTRCAECGRWAHGPHACPGPDDC